MIIYVDIDGTICTLNSSDDENKDQSFDPAGYEDAQPIEENIDKINKLYDEGHTIIYWTARGTVTKIDWIELTRQQLFEWGCKCHDVRVGKPQYDLWIDDKSMRIEEVSV
tara:strand:+ start:1426 stop:1755 length:330 start_codon:yes stop_codon:yes gene_type:complete